MSRALFIFALITFAGCDVDQAADPAAATHVDLQSLESVHTQEGEMAFRLEATFVGADRRSAIQGLLDAAEVVPLDDLDVPPPAVGDAAERAAHAIERLATEGGEGVVVQVHPLRPADQGRAFGYRINVEAAEVPPTPAAEDAGEGLSTLHQDLSLSPGGLRFYDLWCYAFRVRYRIRSGFGHFAVTGPLGYIPLPTLAPYQYNQFTFFFPTPWPSPWGLIVMNTDAQRTMVYDAQISCAQ